MWRRTAFSGQGRVSSSWTASRRNPTLLSSAPLSLQFLRGVHVEIYTTTWCPYCVRAKKLLKAKGVDFKEINLEEVAGGREEMGKRTDRSTVPQIFIDNKHIGGCDDLHALDAKGQLDPLLGLKKEK